MIGEHTSTGASLNPPRTPCRAGCISLPLIAYRKLEHVETNCKFWTHCVFPMLDILPDLAVFSGNSTSARHIQTKICRLHVTSKRNHRVFQSGVSQMFGKLGLRRALFILAGASCAAAALSTNALAYYDTTVCNRDGYDCYRVRCDDDGDDCHRIARDYQMRFRDRYDRTYPAYGYYRDDDDRRGWYGSEEDEEDGD